MICCHHLEILNILTFSTGPQEWCGHYVLAIMDAKDISNTEDIARTHACWDKAPLIRIGLDLLENSKKKKKKQKKTDKFDIGMGPSV